LDTNIALPVITPAAQEYAWRQLASRAGFDAREISWRYGEANAGVDLSTPAIVISRASDKQWKALLTLDAQQIEWHRAAETIPSGAELPFDNLVPILFWGDKGIRDPKAFAEKLPNGSVVFHADIIAATLFMLTRWEETVLPQRDEHGRFPAAASAAYRLGFLDIPIVDQYALILREWIKAIVPNWQPKKNIPTVNLTHDIDFIYQYPTALTFARTIKDAIFSNQPYDNVKQALKDLKIQLTAPEDGERYRAIFQLAETSKKHGFQSQFYFMAARQNSKQEGYDPALPRLKKIYRFLKKEGHEIGFHPGYNTFGNLSLLKKEKVKLEQALEEKVTSGRQHFLRFQVPRTWRDWEEAGLLRDSTLGYAEQEGFRGGTCHPYHPFDLERDHELSLLEVPLIVMDPTLKHYKNMTAENAKERILHLAARCFEVEGTFTLLWHNTLLHDSFWHRAYIETLAVLEKNTQQKRATM
jgi:hypothetical protein